MDADEEKLYREWAGSRATGKKSFSSDEEELYQNWSNHKILQDKIERHRYANPPSSMAEKLAQVKRGTFGGESPSKEWSPLKELLDQALLGTYSGEDQPGIGERQVAKAAWEREHPAGTEVSRVARALIPALAVTGAGRAADLGMTAAGAGSLSDVLLGQSGSNALMRAASSVPSGAWQGGLTGLIDPELRNRPGGIATAAATGAIAGPLGSLAAAPLRSAITPETASLARSYISQGGKVATGDLPGAPLAAKFSRGLGRLLRMNSGDVPALTKAVMKTTGSSDEEMSQAGLSSAMTDAQQRFVSALTRMRNGDQDATKDALLANNQWHNGKLLLDSNVHDEVTGQVDPSKLYRSVVKNYRSAGNASNAAIMTGNPSDLGSLAQGAKDFSIGQSPIHLSPSLGLAGGLGLGAGAGAAVEEGLPFLSHAMNHPLLAGAAAVGGGVLGGESAVLGPLLNTETGRNLLLAGAERGGLMRDSLTGSSFTPSASAVVSPEYTGRRGPINSKYSDLFQQAGEQYGVDPSLLSNQAWFESGLDPNASNSKSGAKGISQFIPSTAKQYGVDVNDVGSSISGQARYMKDLLSQFNGNEGLALAAYNWGPGNVAKWRLSGADPDKLPSETKSYVQNITGVPMDSWLTSGPSVSAPNQLSGNQ